MATKKRQESSATDSSIERKKYTDTLRVRLTDEELIDRAQEQSRTLQLVEDMEADLKSKTQHAKAAIGERNADIKRLSVEIRDRATYRPVDCERVYDYRSGTVTEVRLDTGETINTRAMNYAEMQRGLPFNGDDHAKDEELDEEEDGAPTDDDTGKLEAEADEEGARMGGRRRGRRSGRGAEA